MKNIIYNNIVILFHYQLHTMKKLLKKMPLRKKESERTKREKLVRNIAFFAVVIFGTVLGALVFIEECKYVDGAEELVAMGIY